MKRILWIMVPALLTVNCLHGQIGLNIGSYPASVIGTDSLKVTTAASAFPSLAPVENGIWDMSIVTDSAPVFFAYRVPTSTPYQFADSNEYNFASYSYQGNVQSSITSAGIFDYGINVQQVGYGLYPITGNSGDTLIINNQNITYSSSRIKIGFPANYSSSWTSVYESDLNFQLTYSLGGFTLAPGIMKKYITEKDSVIGWGKMRIKDITGFPSDYLNVLQVQTVIIQTDSFFINSAPFSLTMLSFFGLSQFQKDTTYEQNYYRTGEVTALAQVEFRDAAYTQPYKATTHVQRLMDVGVPAATGNNSLRIYPNPVTTDAVSVELPATGAWNYALIGMDGKEVARGTLQAKEKIVQLELPAWLHPGFIACK